MSSNKRDIFRRFIIVLSVFSFLGALIALIVASRMLFGIGVICPFNELFGWNCPGCGGTRMVIAILEGKFYQAFRYNMYVFISIPIVGVILAIESYKFVRYNEFSSWIDGFLIFYIAGFVAFGIIRNMEPFTWMAPMGV